MYLIERYVWRAVLPYFLLAWGLLTTILFLQQSSRFAEIFFGGKVPADLIWEIGFAVLPNVVAFTSPLAVLAGIVIGFGRMQGDSELVAMRAAGIAAWRLAAPCLFLGILLSGLALYVNFRSVPEAATTLRKALLRAAIYKVESPVEPGVFTTDIPNFVIYVREGNREEGTWEKVFLYSKAANGNTRFITARSGRIDAEKGQSELVLREAVVTNLNLSVQSNPQNVAVERVAELRIALETQRKELLKKLQTLEITPEELSLSELYRFASDATGKERLEAWLLLHRRISLALAPLVISLLGVGLSLRFGRGGRGWSVFLALVSAISYYTLALIGEQFARAEIFSPFFGVWLATLAAVALGSWWLLTTRRSVSRAVNLNLPANFWQRFESRTRKRLHIPLFGILERDLWLDVGRWFITATAALSFLYLTFTAFELWKFVGTGRNGRSILFEYLLFLLPLVIWQIIPAALMIAVLTTYSVKARRGEIAAWQAAGQSVYRLFLPCLLFAVLLGLFSWILQETILPQTNRRQDLLRNRLRNGGNIGEQNGRFWIADDRRIYSFTANKENIGNPTLRDVLVFEFEETTETHLATIFRSEEGFWNEKTGFLELTGKNEKINGQKLSVHINLTGKTVIDTNRQINPFTEVITKTAHLSSPELRKKIDAAESETERKIYRVALQKKYAGGFVPIVIAIFSVPFALTFGRRAGTLSLGYAFLAWLLFTGIGVLFERLGEAGFLRAEAAIWSPLILFFCFGLYLFSRTKT